MRPRAPSGWWRLGLAMLGGASLAACAGTWRDDLDRENVSRRLAAGPEAAPEHVEDCAHGGRADACEAVGIMFEHGAGVARSARMAEMFFHKGCELDARLCLHGASFATRQTEVLAHEVACLRYGDAAACGSAGTAYLWGDGVDVDPPRANELLTTACEAKTAASSPDQRRWHELHRDRACTELGLAHLLGVGGVERDAASALSLLDAQCARRDARACAYRGLASELGLGVAKDRGVAFAEYEPFCTLREHERALVSGEAEPAGTATELPFACYRLAVLGADSPSSPRDVEVAAQLYAHACYGGDRLASVACAPAASLFFRHDFALRMVPANQPWTGARGGVALAKDMALRGCVHGATDACRLLRSIHEQLAAEAL